MRSIAITIAAVLLGLVSIVSAESQSAVDALETRQDIIAQAQQALDSAPNSNSRNEALNEAIRETFDFNRLARESIGGHWSRMTEAQQTEYLRLFNQLVEKSTVDKLRNYRAASTEYVDVQQNSTDATITTVVTSQGGSEVAIQYKMYNENGRWWVWDTTIGLDTEITEYDVSTSENYRSAFNKIIGDHGIDELLDRLRTKAESGDDI